MRSASHCAFLTVSLICIAGVAFGGTLIFVEDESLRFSPPRVEEHPTLYQDSTLESYFQLVGSGVAVVDLDDDGDLDIILPGAPGVADRLYRNQLMESGSLAFEEELLPTDARAWRRSAMVIDIDRDGRRDIVLHGDALESDYGSAVLFQRDEGYEWVVLPGVNHAASGVLVTPLVDGGPPYILLLSWSLEFLFATQPRETFFAAPQMEDDPSMRIRVLSYEGGAFIEHDNHPISEAGGTLFVATALDIDDNERTDLFITHDLSFNSLLRQLSDGDFVDIASGLALDSGDSDMGVDIADLDDDGHLDIFTTQIFNTAPDIRQGDTNRLFMNRVHDPSIGEFVDEAARYGVTATDWAWSAYFADLDHDTDLDLLVASGCDEFPRVFGIGEHPVSFTPNYLFRNTGNESFEIATGTPLDEERNSRVVLPADFDRDGDLDLFELHMYTPGRILLNETEGLPPALTLIPGPDEAAQGATLWLELEDRTIRRDIIPGRGYLSQSPGEFHLAAGLKEDATFSATLDWADGTTTELEALPAAGILRLLQPTCDDEGSCVSSPGWRCEQLSASQTRCAVDEELELAAQYVTPTRRTPSGDVDAGTDAGAGDPDNDATGTGKEGCSSSGRRPALPLLSLALLGLVVARRSAAPAFLTRPAG